MRKTQMQVEKMERIKESVCRFYLDNKDECDLHYSAAESKNINTIYEDVIDERIVNFLFTKVSIVVLTANKYEKNVLHCNIFEKSKQQIKRFTINLFGKNITNEETYAYWFKWGDYTVLHIEAQKTGSYTVGGAADIVRYIVNNKHIFPTAIISLGICFGTNENEYSLGDVVMSEKIYPYFVGSKIKGDKYFVDDDNMFRINPSLRAKVKLTCDENAFKGQARKVYFGNYITGEAVISNLEIRNQFANITKQKIIAGEMEGYGIFKECRCSGRSLPCIIIKSICDWAAVKDFDSDIIFKKLYGERLIVSKEECETLKDRIQAYAAFQSFEVLNILIGRYIFDDSLYKRLVKHLKASREKVVHAKIIKQKIYQMCDEYQVSDSFVFNIIKSLVDDKLLINEIENCSENKIWKCTFLINKEMI